MKIVYQKKSELDLSKYGIEIPLMESRTSRLFDFLNQHFEVNELVLKSFTVTIDDYKRVHDAKFIDEIFDPISRDNYFYKCYELIDQSGKFHRYNPTHAHENFSHAFEIIKTQVELNYQSLKMALYEKNVFFIGGGMHHAIWSLPRGFCLVHDGLIGLAKLLAEKLIKSAWVIDVDAHKGDGAPEILSHCPDLKSKIKTFSIHMCDAWPLNEDSYDELGDLKPWFIPNDLDICHKKGEENNYLTKLEQGLLDFEKKFSLPDLVWIVLGADPYEGDVLESTQSLKLSLEQMLERDMLIYHFFKSRNVSQCFVIGGGYGHETWKVYAQFLNEVSKSERLF